MAAPGENLRINADRLWDSIHEMAEIGPGIAGGNNRQTLTDDDGQARHLFKKWCEEAGMSVSVDAMGTMFAQREGTDPDALPVYVGSHLDTQPTGGRYDGVLGVLGGLEVIRSLNDLGIKTKHPIVVTNWTNEEGTRFAPAMLASGVFAGVHELDWAYARQDARGKRFGDELERIGWKGDEEVGSRPMKAFFELHIEQGPILEDEGIDIGVVTHGQGLWWLEVRLTGKDAHTGSTPMPKRRNAGLGMARVTELVHEVAMDYQPDAVGAVGHIEVYPNSRNIIAGNDVARVRIDLDMAHRAHGVGLVVHRHLVHQLGHPRHAETGIAALRHRRRAGMRVLARQPHLEPPQALAVGDDADVDALVLEDRPLLDMQLEERLHRAAAHLLVALPADALQLVAEALAPGVLTRVGPVELVHAGEHAGGEHRRREAGAFLVGPVGDDNRVLRLDTEIVEAADHLQPAEDAQHAVIAAARRLRVEMGAHIDGQGIGVGALALREHSAHGVHGDGHAGFLAPFLEEVPCLAVIVGQRLPVVAAGDAGADLGHLVNGIPEAVRIDPQIFAGCCHLVPLVFWAFVPAHMQASPEGPALSL